MFCPNDYDDACVGPAVWDLARFLDEALWEGKHWLVRSRHHARVGIKPEDIALADEKPGKRLAQYAAACGEALAHARGDRRSTRFEAAIAAELITEASALIAAARRYAQRVTDDRQLLCGMLGNCGQDMLLSARKTDGRNRRPSVPAIRTSPPA